MPSSHTGQLNEIMDLIILTDPQKLLDIGIGFGKYGFLSREYLEMWNSANEYLHWTRQIDGIEAFEPYITPLHEKVYNRIFLGDALTILPTLTEKYDLILLIDVLEHFSHEDGLKILGLCRKYGRNMLISVPKVMAIQGEVYGNAYEEHKFNWSPKDLAFLEEKFFLPNDRSTICFIGEDWNRIRMIIKNRRTRSRVIKILELMHMKNFLKSILKNSS